MKASVVIATKDRKDDLRRAIASAVKQTEPVEVLVLDDGSTDGTSEMVKSEFPGIRLERSAVPLGLVAQRNKGALLCSGEIIFSIDDDAEFSTAQIVKQTLRQFSHPRIAAIAIPFVEPHRSEQEFDRAPDAHGVWIADTFKGTSHALRRDAFLKVGGYREQIIHQGEELDLCIRLMNNGFVVRLGFGDVINHYESSKRDWRRIEFYARRNDVLFAWRNVPMPYLPVHLLATTFNGLACAIRTSRPSAMIVGLVSGYRDCTSKRTRRAPVSPAIYRLHRMLKKGEPRLLRDIEGVLPSLTLVGADQHRIVPDIVSSGT